MPKTAPVQLATAKDDPVHGDVGKRSDFDLRDGRKFEVRYNEADVSFSNVSIGEALQQSNWFVFGPGCQMMLPGSRPSAAKLEKHRTFWCGTVVPRPQGGLLSHRGATSLSAGSRCHTSAVG